MRDRLPKRTRPEGESAIPSALRRIMAILQSNNDK
jgi:hypothetical protein